VAIGWLVRFAGFYVALRKLFGGGGGGGTFSRNVATLGIHSEPISGLPLSRETRLSDDTIAIPRAG
jgi:hypothetical protein